MRVEFQRFGGLSPALTNRMPALAAELTEEEASDVRRLVPPEFFALQSSESVARAPDAFRYRIVVDDGARRHEVTVGEHELPDALRPLVTWLERKARSA